MRRTCSCLAMACLLAGCMSPKLTRHYGMVDETVVSDGELSLSVFPASPKADEQAPLITTLTERGQAELIRSVAARMPDGSDASALLALLGKPPVAIPEACGWANKTSLKKRVTLTVLGKFGRPADRVDRLEFRFSREPGARYEFASWDKFDSVYGSYDLGTAKYTQSRKLTLGRSDSDTRNLADEAGSVVKGLSAGYEAADGLEENMRYAIRRLSVGGALEPSRATLVQEGGPYINLLGSSSAVFTLKLNLNEDPSPVHAFEFKQGRKTAPDAVLASRCQARYPISRQEIWVQVDGSALKRLALHHHDTISEGDDAVRFESQAFKAERVRLATKDDLKVEFFGLISCPNGVTLDACPKFAVENPDTGTVTDMLAVRTPDDAAAVRDWLLANVKSGTVPGTIGAWRIGLTDPQNPGEESKTALTPDIVRKLRIARVAGNADAAEASGKAAQK